MKLLLIKPVLSLVKLEPYAELCEFSSFWRKCKDLLVFKCLMFSYAGHLKELKNCMCACSVIV